MCGIAPPDDALDTGVEQPMLLPETPASIIIITEKAPASMTLNSTIQKFIECPTKYYTGY